MGALEGFKVTLIVMLFYSLSITTVAHFLEDAPYAQNHILEYQNVGEGIDMEGTATDIEDSLTQQTNIPVIEVGALVFYSGNILLDLLLNFVYAIPQMVGLLIHGFMSLLNVNTYLWAQIQIFASVLMTVMYFIGLMQMLMGARSGVNIT